MSRFTKQITSYWQQFRTVVRNEYGSIFTDAGVILVLVLALLIYSTLYSLAYGTQVLRNVPIGVIDMSNTSTSRQLINTFNAGPNVYVAYEPGDMDEAKHLFYDREIYGVVYIPSDYEEKLPQSTFRAGHSRHSIHWAYCSGVRTAFIRPAICSRCCAIASRDFSAISRRSARCSLMA